MSDLMCAKNVSPAGTGEPLREVALLCRRNTRVQDRKYRERVEACMTKPPPPDAEDYFVMGEEDGRPESRTA